MKGAGNSREKGRHKGIQMLRSAEKSESGTTDIDSSGWINLDAMNGIESRVQKEAWIVAEDAVVDFLVLESFSETTLQNLQRGVNYRFLVSEGKAQEMEDFEGKISKERACSSSLKLDCPRPFWLWIGATWAFVETKKSLQILFGAILLSLAVNFLGDWLGNSV
jgi:hypothetical protein